MRKNRSTLAYAYRPGKRNFYGLCVKIAKQHPKWSAAKVEAKATVLSLGEAKSNPILERNNRVALKHQPDLKTLELELLGQGGNLVSLQYEPDLENLLIRGHLFKGKERWSVHMSTSRCHSNVASVWNKNPKIYKIATGWALSKDGIWRQHTWLMKGNTIIETTEPREEYYGIVLSAEEANQFWWANQ